jgi:hypothetical protein
MQSASTNSASITVVIYGDGSADRTTGAQGNLPSPAPMTYASGSPAVVTFLSDLTAVGDVSTIPTESCGKSVSFGTTTTVTSNGKTSGDLQCANMPSAAQAALIQDCNVLLGSNG